MSDQNRTLKEVKTLLQSSVTDDPQETINFYNSWAEAYEKDTETICYRAPHLLVNFLDANFSGSRQDVQVLDIACGSGLAAKLMSKLGFKHFVGVDGSKGMLDLADETKLYKDLKLALLGTEPLPVEKGVFDVVIVAGGLGAGFIPVSVIRELYEAAKPGGLICMTLGHHGEEGKRYKNQLEKELQLMEQEGRLKKVGIKHSDQYMGNAHENTEGNQKNQQGEQFISGCVYLYKKSNSQSQA